MVCLNKGKYSFLEYFGHFQDSSVIEFSLSFPCLWPSLYFIFNRKPTDTDTDKYGLRVYSSVRVRIWNLPDQLGLNYGQPSAY